MLRMHESNHVFLDGETPSDLFYAVEDALSGMEAIAEDWTIDRGPQGDVLFIDVEYVNPEGRQVDVDRFAPTYCMARAELDFGIELDED